MWGDHGQEQLEKAHVCVVGASTLGTETLKNIVLPGAVWLSFFAYEATTFLNLVDCTLPPSVLIHACVMCKCNAGVGAFTIVDNDIVTQEDLGTK